MLTKALHPPKSRFTSLLLAVAATTALILPAAALTLTNATVYAAKCTQKQLDNGYHTISEGSGLACRKKATDKPKDKKTTKSNDSGSGSAVDIDSTEFRTDLPKATASSDQLQHLLSIAFAIIGGIALLFVVIGALRYILAGGDPQAAAKARNTIIYAAIGVIIIIAAEIIVAFVLDKL